MTKKLLSILLAVLMVMTYVTPAMALPLDLNPLEEVVEGGEAAAPVEEVEEPVAEPTDEVDAVVPDAEIQAKPSKLSSAVVQRMKIQAYAVSGTKTGSCTPSQGAKLLSYTIGDVVGSDEEGWTTTVTFHFQSGDKFEASAASTFSGLSTFKGCEGNWVYYFNETHPADQTLTLYRSGNAWAYYNYSGVLTKISSRGNINIGHLIAVDMRLDTELPKSYTVTYTDGVEDEEVFADQTYTVEEGKATPAFNGTPAREGYEFAGWQPEVAETVTADATYTAQWKVESKAVARVESTGEEYETLQAAIDAAKALIDDANGDHAAQTVTLLKDVTESVTAGWVRTKDVEWNFDLTIDLNGKTITGNGGSVISATDSSNFAATQTYTLRIKDSVGTGVVTGGNAKNGGAVYLSGKSKSTIVIDGGTFTGNVATSSGGAIYTGGTSMGKVVVNNGTFTNNTALTGGAINSSDVTINGGVFTGNSATGTEKFTGRGGAICVWSTTSSLVMTGGQIYGNTAALNGDDIVWASTSTARVSSPKLSLVSAKSMGVFARGWYRDEVDSRYSAENAVEFTDYANYKGKGIDKAVSLKAVLGDPEYTVTYTDGVNGTAFADQSYTVKEGTATPAFNGTPERAGYTFAGWQPEVAATVTADVTYTAQWTAIKYKLTFNGNGTNQLSGTISGNYTSKTKYTEGTNVNLNTAMDGKKFTKALSDDYSTNYRQIGWNTKADGTGDHYAMNGTFVMPASDVILYAEWESYEWIHWNVQMSEGGDHINYTTKYMGPKADVQSFKAYTGNVGTSAGKVPAAYYTPVKAYAKEGYRFIGWYDVAKNECISTNDTLYVQDFRNLRALKLAESGAVLEARFEAKKASNIHVVIYKASDLTKPVVSKAVTNLYDGDIFTPNIADYYSSANGFEYVGWFNDGNFNNYKAGKSYTEATEFTVTGAWQNVIAVVTDYEKVVVKAVYDGDKDNAKTVYSGLALRGTNVIEYLEANAGVGEVEGYALDKWFNWDWYGHKVAENATVNGWTNVYVTYTRNVFTVTYTDGVDGEEVFADQSYQVKYGEATPAFNGTPERTGYTFKGWQPAVAETVTEDVTYTAQWEAVKYKLTFNGNGTNKLSGTISGNYTSKTRYTMGTEVNLQAAMDGKKFTKALSDDYSTNYRQIGWNTKADGTGDHYAMNGKFTMPAADTVLYAEWESYEWIHWNVQMGEGGDHINYTTKYMGPKADVQSFKAYTGNMGNQYGKVPAAYYTPVKAVAKEGYQFVGWYDVSKNNCISTADTLYVKDFRNLRALKFDESGSVLEARFELKDVTVTYVDGVDGAAFASESHTVKYGQPTPAFEGSTDNYIGWVFNGWNPKVASTVTEDVTYTAQWRMKGANTVIYYGNEGVRSNGDTFWSEYTNGQTKTLSYNTGYYEFARTGWHFTGWNTKADGTGDAYAAGATYTFTAAHNLETVELYAQWERNTYTVKYVDGVNGAAFADESHTAKYEDATPAFEGSTDKYIGWVFNGWNPKVADKVTEDVTYTAKWRMKGANTLYYHANGGAKADGSEIYSEYTNAVSITVKSNGYSQFVRDEYKFIGWNTKADGTGTAYKAGDTYSFEYAHNLEKGYLYAQWEHIACDKHLEDVKVIKEPTCTEDGLKLCRCTVCGKEIEVVIPALGHDHSGKWTWNREDHWKKCTRCGEILDRHEHIYGEWKSIDDNREERSCTVCGFTQYAQIIKIDGKPTTKPTDEENPNTGAEVR